MTAYVDPRVASITAKLAGVRGELRITRDGIVTRAKTELAAHRDQGDSKITGTRGTIDFFANLEDEAAAAIEFGGTAKDGTPISGLHVMRRAAGT